MLGQPQDLARMAQQMAGRAGRDEQLADDR